MSSTPPRTTGHNPFPHRSRAIELRSVRPHPIACRHRRRRTRLRPGPGHVRLRRRHVPNIFVKAATDLTGYRECAAWLDAIREIADSSLPPSSRVNINYTGRPAFVAEISASMKHDIILSVGGTAMISPSCSAGAPPLETDALAAHLARPNFGRNPRARQLDPGRDQCCQHGLCGDFCSAWPWITPWYIIRKRSPIRILPCRKSAAPSAPSIFWAATTTICAFSC